MFNTDELKDIISPFAEVIDDYGTLVCDWRCVLSKKYSKLPGIHKLHDFIYVKNLETSGVVVKDRRLCYSGSFERSTCHVLSGVQPSYNAVPSLVSQNDIVLKKTRELTD